MKLPWKKKRNIIADEVIPRWELDKRNNMPTYPGMNYVWYGGVFIGHDKGVYIYDKRQYSGIITIYDGIHRDMPTWIFV